MSATLQQEIERAVVAEPVYACVACQDSGHVITERDGARKARRCECLEARAADGRMLRAGIPAKYATATLQSLQTSGAHPSLVEARLLCAGLVEEFPLASAASSGLLLQGSCGLGKTHLAAATLKAVMARYRVAGRFWSVAELLTQLKATFTRGAGLPGGQLGVETESSLVEEFARVPVLVLDDLGAERMTEWAFNEVNLLLDERYRALGRGASLTLVTTNLAVAGHGEGGQEGGVYRETLGDRIGARGFSRLMEMCPKAVRMAGKDFRLGRRG